MSDTQKERLLSFLLSGREVSPLTAWEQLGIYRLAARIHDLRKDGYQIDSRDITVQNQFGESVVVSCYYIDLFMSPEGDAQ